jgi:hypothetical protein
MLAAHPTAALPLQLRAEKLESLRDGGHSSMVEPQIVVLAVAGSSPVGHPEDDVSRDESDRAGHWHSDR